MDNTTIVVVDDDRKRQEWLTSHVRHLAESTDTPCENGYLGVGVITEKGERMVTMKAAEHGAEAATAEGSGTYYRNGNRLTIKNSGMTTQMAISDHDEASVENAFCGFPFNYLVVDRPETVSVDSYARIVPTLVSGVGPRRIVLFTKQMPAVEGDKYVLGPFRIPVTTSTVL